MPGLKIAAALALVVLLGAAGWGLTHWRKIKGELLANDLMPRPGPDANVVLLYTVAFLALSGLMLFFLLS
jgi:hypothetical protein